MEFYHYGLYDFEIYSRMGYLGKIPCCWSETHKTDEIQFTV